MGLSYLLLHDLTVPIALHAAYDFLILISVRAACASAFLNVCFPLIIFISPNKQNPHRRISGPKSASAGGRPRRSEQGERGFFSFDLLILYSCFCHVGTFFLFVLACKERATGRSGLWIGSCRERIGFAHITYQGCSCRRPPAASGWGSNNKKVKRETRDYDYRDRFQLLLVSFSFFFWETKGGVCSASACRMPLAVSTSSSLHSQDFFLCRPRVVVVVVVCYIYLYGRTKGTGASPYFLFLPLILLVLCCSCCCCLLAARRVASMQPQRRRFCTAPAADAAAAALAVAAVNCLSLLR